MRILHILEATYGGTRRHVLDLLPALQRRGLNCELIYSSVRNPNFPHDAAWLHQQGINTYEVPMMRSWGGARDAYSWRALQAHLRTHRYDIIHCHSTKAGVLGRLAAFAVARSTPVVYTPHCLAFATGLPLRQRRAARWVEKLLAPLTAHFVAVSHHERRTMLNVRLCQPARTSVIHNAIDLEALAALPAATRNSFGLSEDDLVIGCFGRLTRQKNQDALLRALPIVQKQAPNVRLLLVGGGEDETALRHTANRLGVSHRVVWTGDREEARPLYALCDIVAQPSRWEGCPYSILEAMAMRRAIVARGIGGVPELLMGESAIVYKPSHQCPELEVLAEHLVALARSGETRTHLGDRARQRVETRFQLEDMVSKTVQVYEQVTGGDLAG